MTEYDSTTISDTQPRKNMTTMGKIVNGVEVNQVQCDDFPPLNVTVPIKKPDRL